MAEPPLLERLTASDLFMLLWDDYGWPNQIGGLAILDGTTLLDRDGRVRIEAIRRRIEPRLAAVPRFRQLLSRPRLGLGWPLWVDAPAFDLADHLRVHPLGAPADHAQLLRACAELAATAGSRPAAVGAVAAPRPASATGGRVLEAAPRPRRRPRGGGRLRGAAGPGRRGAHPGRPAVDADPDPDHQDAAGRQPAPTPPATRSRVVGPGPSGQDPASGPSGLAGMAGSLHRTARAPRPASTSRSGPTGGWPSSVAAWTAPSSSPTATRPRSTTWS
jgi:Wax ester synthase-like Acyl-CoA acyltransferase domain